MTDREQWYTCWIAALLLVGLVSWAMGAGCHYTRVRETACAQAGGALMHLPPLQSGGDREMCAKITKLEFEQVPLAR